MAEETTGFNEHNIALGCPEICRDCMINLVVRRLKGGELTCPELNYGPPFEGCGKHVSATRGYSAPTSSSDMYNQ